MINKSDFLQSTKHLKGVLNSNPDERMFGYDY